MNRSVSTILSYLKARHGQCGLAVDIGAHHGEFSKLLVQSNSFSQVLAFEPNFENCFVIRKSVSSSSSCEFKLINSALSSYSGLSELYCDSDTSTASLLEYDSGYQNRGDVKKNFVSTLTLDEYFDENPTNHSLEFVKIDTQGNDLSVLMGSTRSISKFRPVIQTEFIYIPLYKSQCSPSELSRVLNELGYIIYSLNNLHVNPEGRLCFCDAVFVPKEFDISITQEFYCIDNEISFHLQINKLNEICRDRLAVINVLDAEIQRLRDVSDKTINIKSFFSKLKSWVQ